jgi:alpha-tubulin suppressor-like RCC1 family protein
MKRRLWVLVLLGLACNDEVVAPGDLVPVDRVVILSTNREILLGDTLRLQAVGISADGDTLHGRQLTWSSSDPLTVELTPGGHATALLEGSVAASVTIEGRSAQATVTAVRLEFQSISAGGSHTCAVAVDGTGWCWGSNGSGELGGGGADQLEHRVPQRVTGAGPWQTIQAGAAATCAIASAGSAWCWGVNHGGQLGDGSTTDRYLPVVVSGGLTFTSISTPQDNVCGVVNGGSAYCWGQNYYGKLGDGTREARLTPTPVQGGLNFSDMSTTSFYFSCGLTTGGSAACWGANYGGYLGYDTVYYNTSPYPVAGGHAFVQLSAEYYRGCGLEGNGNVHCWGFKRFHHSGKESSVPVLEPAPVTFASFGEGGEHACGLTALGEAWCWGANTEGQLGNGRTGTQNVEYPATRVAGGLTFTSLSVGQYHTCGLVASGAAYCWGDNQAGSLGTGSSLGEVTTPELVTGNHLFTSISVRSSSCAIDDTGAAWCWGWGALGNGSTFSATPVPVSGGLVFESIFLGRSKTCGIAGGETYCWGDTPVLLPGGHTFTRLALGSYSDCGLDDTGAAWCWGSNYHGTVGDGTEIPRTDPTLVVGGHVFADIVAGDQHVCALTTGGVTYCWGDNLSGQLGNGVTPDSPFPLLVKGGLTFTQIGTSSGNGCGLTAANDVYCWPQNPANPGPALLPGGIKFTTITKGYSHGCGLTSAGSAYCWGENDNGQLGNGSVLPPGRGVVAPVPVTGGLTFRSLSAGAGHTCGITIEGSAYCWGQNYSGQLSGPDYGDVGGVPFPVKVLGQR